MKRRPFKAAARRANAVKQQKQLEAVAVEAAVYDEAVKVLARICAGSITSPRGETEWYNLAVQTAIDNLKGGRS